MKDYQDKEKLEEIYKKYGSSRNAAPVFGISYSTVLNWLRKYQIERTPQLHLSDNPSGWGRLNELYIAGHPAFVKGYRDFGEFDKFPFDGIWLTEKVNIKCTHSKSKKTFRIKNKRHVVKFYICCIYDDDLDPLIPIAIYVIPAYKVSHTSITVSLSPNSKYERFRLKPGIDFDIEEAGRYNKEFKEKYSYPVKR
ncbi:MAG: hypothetical protein M1607_02205 [Patescibacteria group bacterium]|nr:hypothetical protein [Patescibacteria group bacterium]